ncbi:transmembrane protein 269 isoform X2 [Fukomys damarensis]|uniref:transmembrane protein 269 isoform X2 n=1 Tax=Fukomys damarensis TaxID=885580 RepID=UPI00053F6DCB|nr:transmembrane protein 269 isoform X2 [Fukomys damarensis]
MPKLFLQAQGTAVNQIHKKPACLEPTDSASQGDSSLLLQPTLDESYQPHQDETTDPSSLTPLCGLSPRVSRKWRLVASGCRPAAPPCSQDCELRAGCGAWLRPGATASIWAGSHHHTGREGVWPRPLPGMSHPQASCWTQGTPVCALASTVAKEEDKVGSASTKSQMLHGQCSSFSLHHNQSHLKINEFSWKKVANALSLANMVLGLFSIFCSFNRKSHCASWMLLMSFLLDIVVGAMTRHLNICCKTGAELNDFAIFTTFGLASGLLLGVDGPLNGFVAIVYVLTTSFRLGFYSSGVPFSYKGLPCPYASCVLASISLLTKGNTFILCCMASLMILFMTDQSYYPRDDVLESENWKKVVYVGGVIMLFFSPFSLTAFYCLMWSLSYIFFLDALWGRAASLRL